MRGFKSVIAEAELMALPPQTVAEALRIRAEKPDTNSFDDPVDEVTEQRLLDRADPLVSLALARYCRHLQVAEKIFREADAKSPLRLACLTNKTLDRQILASFPVGLFGDDSASMAEWLLTASMDELQALFENPALSDSFLRDLLERTQEWARIPDDKLCAIVSILHRNPRMRTARNEDYMDGYAEYSYAAVFDAGWKLAGTVPVNEAWARALAGLYTHLQADAHSIDDPLQLAKRWHVDPANSEAWSSQERDHRNGHLGTMEQVRQGLARLALRVNRPLLNDLITSEDLAYRATAYAYGELDAQQLLDGYSQDGEIVLTEALNNEWVWRDAETRKALREIAWSVVKADKHADLLAANLYSSKEKSMRQKYPDWFEDEPEKQHGDIEIDLQAPATKLDLVGVTQQLDQQARDMHTMGQSLRSVMTRTAWIWWFALGALVASINHL